MPSGVGITVVTFVASVLSGGPSAQPADAHCVRFSAPPRIAAGTEFRVPLPRRSVVPWSLAEIGDRRAIGPVLDVLDRGDPFMRVLAIFALETLKATQALPKLRQLLDDSRATHVGQPITVAEAARRAIIAIEGSR